MKKKKDKERGRQREVPGRKVQQKRKFVNVAALQVRPWVDIVEQQCGLLVPITHGCVTASRCSLYSVEKRDRFMWLPMPSHSMQASLLLHLSHTVCKLRFNRGWRLLTKQMVN